MAQQCTKASDCTVGLVKKVCYLNVPWANQFVNASFLNEKNVSFCECSNFYGFTGEQCDQPSSTTRLHKAFNLIFIIWSSFFLVWLTSILMSYIYWKKPSFRDLLTLKIDLGFFIALSSFLAFLFQIIHSSLNLVSLQDPSTYQIITLRLVRGEVEDVYSHGGTFTVSALYLSGSFILLSTLQVAFTWLQILESVSMFGSARDKIWNRRLALFFKTYMILYLLSVIILRPLGFDGYFSVLIPTTFISYFFLVLLWRTRFLKLFNKVSGKLKDSMKQGLTLVKNTSMVHLLMFGGLFTLKPFMFTALFRMHNLIPVGTFNYAAFLQLLTLVLNLAIVSSNTIFAAFLIKKIVSRLKRTSCIRNYSDGVSAVKERFYLIFSRTSSKDKHSKKISDKSLKSVQSRKTIRILSLELSKNQAATVVEDGEHFLQEEEFPRIETAINSMSARDETTTTQRSSDISQETKRTYDFSDFQV